MGNDNRKTFLKKIKDLQEEDEVLAVLLDHYLTVIEESIKDCSDKKIIKILLQHIKYETEQHADLMGSLTASFKKKMVKKKG